MPRILQAALGLQNLKLILGYRDSAAVFLAMERNEVSGPHHRSFGHLLDQARLAQAGRRLSAAGAVRPPRPPSGLPGRADRARACHHGRRPRADRVHRDAACSPWRGPLRRRRTCRPTASRLCGTAFDATHRDKEFLAEAEKARVFVSPVTAGEVIAQHRADGEGAAGAVDQVRQIMGSAGKGVRRQVTLTCRAAA